MNRKKLFKYKMMNYTHTRTKVSLLKYLGKKDRITKILLGIWSETRSDKFQLETFTDYIGIITKTTGDVILTTTKGVQIKLPRNNFIYHVHQIPNVGTACKIRTFRVKKVPTETYWHIQGVA